MSFFISDVIAAPSATPHAQMDNLYSLVMIAVIFILFYFILIRPQSLRVKEHKELMTKLKKGDEVVMTGGLIGKIVSIEDSLIKMTIAPGVDISVQRSSVGSLLPKGTLQLT